MWHHTWGQRPIQSLTGWSKVWLLSTKFESMVIWMWDRLVLHMDRWNGQSGGPQGSPIRNFTSTKVFYICSWTISQIKLNPDLVLTLVCFLLSPTPSTLQTVLLIWCMRTTSLLLNFLSIPPVSRYFTYLPYIPSPTLKPFYQTCSGVISLWHIHPPSIQNFIQNSSTSTSPCNNISGFPQTWILPVQDTYKYRGSVAPAWLCHFQ